MVPHKAASAPRREEGLDMTKIDEGGAPVYAARCATVAPLHRGIHMQRCAWATDDLLCAYHDSEWGVPLHADRTLFEFLCLEGAQAGLAWRTLLAKRERYREVFHGFDIGRVARMSERELEKALADPGIIRNRLKVTATRDNARAALAAIDAHGSLDTY